MSRIPIFNRGAVAQQSPGSRSAPWDKDRMDKLNALCRRKLQEAASLCQTRSNYNIEVEHWLLKLLEAEDTDLRPILRHYDVDLTRVNREVTRALDGMRTGNARTPGLAP